MRIRTAGKVLLLALLGLATSLVASSVMARGDKKASPNKARQSPAVAARTEE